MGFIISALPRQRFAALLGADDATLAAQGARRITVTETPGTPCRVSLVDADIGETVLLLHFEHHDVPTPFRASHAIFVREQATDYVPAPNHVPPMLTTRLLSVRAFDAEGMMIDADVADGTALAALIARLFGDARAAYLHIHFARPGCYAARVDRHG